VVCNGDDLVVSSATPWKRLAYQYVPAAGDEWSRFTFTQMSGEGGDYLTFG
jgi:hypothetical protein